MNDYIIVLQKNTKVFSLFVWRCREKAVILQTKKMQISIHYDRE